MSAIARDYQAFAGRELALAGVEEGSLVVILADAAAALKDGAEYAKAAKSMAEFATAVVQAFNRRREARRPKDAAWVAGDRTVEGLIKLAKATNRNIKYRQVSEDGAVTELEITEPVLVEIRNARPAQSRFVTASIAEPEPEPEPASAGLEPNLLAATLLGLNDAQLDATVRAIVDALRDTGGAASLHALAAALERRENHRLAAEVRRAI